MKKTPYIEPPIGAAIDLSDDDNEEMGVLGSFGMDVEASKKVKEEVFV